MKDPVAKVPAEEFVEPQGTLSFEQVFEHELDCVDRRRRTAGLDRESDARNDLFGLAFSGGGIRSATFNLGIVQSLERRGVFEHVDYLSTVGGGGFLGGMLSLTMREGGDFPFRQEELGRESAFVTWLRNKSGRLAAKGPRLWLARLRGLLIHLLVVLPLLLLLSLASAGVTFLRDWGLPIPPWWPYPASTLCGLLLVVLYPLTKLLSSRIASGWSRQGRAVARHLRRILLTTAAFAVVVETISLLLWLFHYEIYLWLLQTDPLLLLVFGLIFLGGPLAIVGVLSSELGARWRKIALWASPWILAVAGLMAVLTGGAIFLMIIEDWFSVGLLLAALISAVAVVQVVFDGNASLLLNLFRDRLRKVYLVDAPGSHLPEPEAGRSAITLSEIESRSCCLRGIGQVERGSVAPYHLINAAINLEGSPDPAVQERGADFFTFSRDFFGGARAGYASTQALERVFPRFDLAGAVAVSASEASPNMGRTKSALERSCGALLNFLRPGYWIPNPARLVRPGWIWSVLDRWRWRVPPSVLFREASGRIDESGRWINVGTGEPLDTLGVYELLRRRCRLIVVGDAEFDPEMTFSGLATVIRRARVDLGVRIDLKLDAIRPDVDGLSSSHHVFGTIRYPALEPGEEPVEGVLLYIKSSLTGDEGNEIEDYRARNSWFPHEDVRDQTFGEGQFDAYRDLAFHATERALADLEPGRLDFHTLAGWFEDRKDEPRVDELETLNPKDEDRKRKQESDLAARFDKTKAADRELGRKLIKLRMQLGMTSEASAVFDALLHANPRDAELFEEKASFYRQIGDHTAHLKALEQANAIREHEAAQQNLGTEISVAGFKIADVDFFGDFEWSFHPRINVLLGKNGYGKSHLLRAVVAMLQNDEKITGEYFDESGSKARIEVTIEREGRYQSSVRKRVSFEERFGRVPVLAIPDVRFVDRSRSVFSPPVHQPAELSSDGATLFLQQKSYEERIGTFFYDLALDYYEHGKDLPIFGLLQRSVQLLTDSSFEFDRCTRDDSRVTFWVRTDGNEHHPLPLQKASQGTLSILAMIGLIYRYLGSVYEQAEVPAEELTRQRAIVVIDEIDAHLHPSWQQKIMQLLRDTFPNVQFIVTAHSPLVVAGCKNGEVCVLRRGAVAPEENVSRKGFFVDPVEGHFIGATSGEIYRKIFEVEDKDETYKRLTTRFAERDELEQEQARLEAKIEKQKKKQGTPATEDVEALKRLDEKLFYLHEFEEARAERERVNDFASDNRSLQKRVVRMKAQLEELERREQSLAASVDKLATSLPIDFLRASLERNPDPTPDLEPLIDWLSERELVEEASSLLAGLLEAQPDNLDHLERLAVFYQKHEHYEDALKLFERAADTAPKDTRDEYRDAADRVRELMGA